MESKEYITYSRRAKAVERPQQPLVKSNQFHGYRSTKQWVEETSQRCRGGSIENAEQQQQRQFQSQEAARGLDVTSCRATSRKKDGRGVHFKQENDQTLSRLECKGGEQPSSLVQLAMVRKDGFPDAQAAALSPISLNVAGGGRQVANSPVPAKHSPAVATLPKGVSQTQGQISVISPDGGVQTIPSGRDEEGRHVVWCNAAFEADDDLGSQDSARNNRYSPASCSKNVEDGPLMVPSLIKKQQDQRAWASGISLVSANHSAIFSQENNVSCKPDVDNADAVGRSSSATLMMKSPQQDSRLHRPVQLELESTAGEWYTPMGSEASSHTSRVFTHGNDRPMEQSKARRNLAATPSFKTVMPQTPTHPNRHVPGARARSSSCSNARKYPLYCTDVHSNSNSNPRACISYDNGPRSAKRGGAAPVLVGKANPIVFSPPRSRAPKTTRFQEDPVVEADLEADIEHEIEQEISMEILQLSERLATLHAKQETRRVGAGGQERSKTGGISCPQTPMRNASSPCGSDIAKGKRKGRVVAAKFLQYNNDGTNAKRDKSVKGTERSAAKLAGLSDGPFLGRPNTPRRSLGTPSRLLTKGKPNGHQRSGSPNHMVRVQMMEEQSRGNGRNKVTSDEHMRNRAMMDSGSRRVVRVPSHRNLGEEDRKEWNDRGIGQSNNNTKDSQPAATLCTGSTAVQSNFYPEFERKVDWVKTLRTDPIPTAHPSEVMNPPAPALDERFLKQKSERQDVNAWLRENIGIAGNCETPNFSPYHASSTGVHERGGLQGAAAQADLRKVRMVEEEDTTNSCSTRPSNGRTSSLSNARPATPSRCTPNRPITPARGTVRTVPSRYGTPVKAVLSRATGNNKCYDTKPMMENPGAKNWYRQTTPSKRHSNETRAGLRKGSPTIRRGYPAESAATNGLKDERGVEHNDEEATRRERKITVVGGSEYEKFIQEGVVVIEKRVPAAFCKNIVVDDAQRGQGVNRGVKSKPPSLMKQREMDMCQQPSSDSKPAKKIFIRCSDLIKDKHSLLVKGKQRRLAGQGGVLPSDSEDSVFGRINTRTDLSELDGDDNSRSEEASIIEETKCIQNSRVQQHSTGMCMATCDASEKSSLTPEYDIVYDYESGNARVSSYRPEDYTLEMMLQYVDTLKCERQALPRIRAMKDVAVGNSSPRDSGCIKRRKEGEKRNRFYFNAGGEANKVQVPKYPSIENDGLSPNEIEGLDLESFWCLVGELEGPIII